MPFTAGTRCPLLTLSYKAADVIIDRIEHLPGGYRFWREAMPTRGHKNIQAIRRQWAHTLLATFFPDTFLEMLLTAVLLPSGMIDNRNVKLYQWLLEYIYNGDDTALYSDWLRLKHK